MDAETKGDLDRMLESIVRHLEGMEMRSIERFERLEARQEKLEARQEKLEARQDRFEAWVRARFTALEDRFAGVYDRLEMVGVRMQQLELRVVEELAGTRADVAAHSGRIDRLEARLDAMATQ